jgi:hypothetical protein
MRILMALAASLLLALALVAPVAAGEQHGSCADFGALTAAGAQAGGFGQFVASYARTGSGVISGIVAGEHEGYCAAH